MGNSYFNQITLPTYGIILLNNEAHTVRQHHVLILDSYKIKAIKINMLPKLYKFYAVILRIVNVQFDNNETSFNDDIIKL